MKGLDDNRRGTTVLRAGQSNNQIVAVMLTITLAAAIGFVGTKVTSEIDDSSDFDTSDLNTVENESWTANYTTTYLYTVSVENDPALDGDDDVKGDFEPDEIVYRTSGSDTKLTEGTDYDWYESNGTVQLYNTTATQGSDSDPNGTYVITYNYTDYASEYGNASTSIGSGFADAMSLTDIVFLVLMFGVVLGALLSFRRRR